MRVMDKTLGSHAFTEYWRDLIAQKMQEVPGRRIALDYVRSLLEDNVASGIHSSLQLHSHGTGYYRFIFRVNVGMNIIDINFFLDSGHLHSSKMAVCIIIHIVRKIYSPRRLISCLLFLSPDFLIRAVLTTEWGGAHTHNKWRALSLKP